MRSITEFHKLYFTGCSSRQATKQAPFEKPRRSHKGLIIHIICTQECSRTKLLGKINLVDLAGSEALNLEQILMICSSMVYAVHDFHGSYCLPSY